MRRILDSAQPGSIEELLLESASAPDPNDAQCEAAWVALSARLTAVGASSAVSWTGAPGPTHGVAGTPATGVGSAGGLSAAPLKAGGIAMGFKSVALLGVAALGTAAIVGGTTWRAVPVGRAVAVAATTPRAAVPSASPPSPAVEAGAPRAIALETAPPAAARPAAPSPRPSRAHGPRTGGALDIAKERAAPALLTAESSLVLAARAEVRAGRCDGALERLREGDDRFAGGALEQERQALRVSALACAGRAGEASDAAAAFVERYPNSPYAALLQPGLGSSRAR
jgi:hypothetical protein